MINQWKRDKFTIVKNMTFNIRQQDSYTEV